MKTRFAALLVAAHLSIPVPGAEANWQCRVSGSTATRCDYRPGSEPGAQEARLESSVARALPSGYCEGEVACPGTGKSTCVGRGACESSRAGTLAWAACDGKRVQCSPDSEFHPGPVTSKPEAEGWKRTFTEEFGAELSSDRWSNHYFGFDSDPAFTRDGKAVLRIDEDTRLTPWGGRTVALNTSGPGRFRQKYGWFEIRARVASTGGVKSGHSAFWLLPADRSYLPSVLQGGIRPLLEPFEIDVFEQYTSHPRRNAFTIHAGNNPDFNPAGASSHHELAWSWKDFPFDQSADFHTYAVEWTREKLTWYVDNRKLHESDLVPHTELFLLLNVYDGPANPAVSYPMDFEVDYVRVYALPGS
jgi:hypothetical protein